MSQHKDKTTFFITKYLQELKRKRKVILCGIKAPCLSAGESLVCQRETKQLMIKLLPPQFKEIPTYQKLVIKYNLGIKECVISYQNQSLFGSQLVAKSLLYSSGQLGFFFFFGQQCWLLSRICFWSTSVTIVSTQCIPLLLDPVFTKITIIPANMVRRWGSITQADRLGCICLPHALLIHSPTLAQLNENGGGSSQCLVSVCRNGGW